MKKVNLILLLAVLSTAILYLPRLRGAEPSTFQVAELVTIRWAGRENTHVIRSNGRVERLKQLFERFPRPDGIDDRSYYMSIAMNAVAKEGYEFAGMTSDEVVMKRTVAR